MKTKLFILSCITIAMASCGSPEESANSTATETSSNTATTDTVAQVTAPPAATAPPADMPGEKLIAKSDCIGCHNKDTKIVGPAYVSIAARYEANDENIEMLSGKIINGGTGVWGNIPMTPHPSISKEDAIEMAKYILSLKK